MPPQPYDPAAFWQQQADTYNNEEARHKIYMEHQFLIGCIRAAVPRPKTMLQIGIGFGRELVFLRDHDGEE